MAVSVSELPATTTWTNGIAATVAHSDAVRLFCFPHAGGGASVFRFWLTGLGPGIEVYPIQLPGREGRWHEPPFTQMSTLIAELTQALRPLLRPPFAFFGHSMGAFIAFELARQLRRENRPGPAVLMASSARAPQIPDPDPPVHQMPFDELLEHLKRFDGIPKELLDHPELVSLLLPTLRADMTMCETYTYSAEPRLTCALWAQGGEQDTKVPIEHLRAWSLQTSGEFRLRLFQGDHFYFLKEARAAATRALQDELWRHTTKRGDSNGLVPHANVERVIGKVWAEVLRVPEVNPDDNFFDLGGNSLLMIQAYGKLRESTGTTLSVLDMFRYPTIRLLASAIGAAGIGAG